MFLGVRHPSVPPTPEPRRLGGWAVSSLYIRAALIQQRVPSGGTRRRLLEGGASSPHLTDEKTEAER